MSAEHFLLDTNILSETSRATPDPQVVAFLQGLREGQAFVSSLSVAELERGIHALLPRQPHRAGELRAWLERQILPVYGAYVLPFNLEAARAWGQLTTSEAARKQPPARMDSLIAATAYAHRLTLATRNTADFLAFPIAVFNPWLP
ncbi:type II toxin-antitoxin system VapC family toxin [Deinococcus sp. S9]|uniref:type II toxin-antitoxin system VapC family toxin n=1 Tax=Deinococcus sp. S9 TaxID=2545754 RepID=UPI001056A3CD|nr:type II toxin-antitoxin system VapC family toxin [Deinococcus sp. S9]TDE85224.1 type II toxin-antitoxin system VapC family toxin [Deinococcus sp. S9]